MSIYFIIQSSCGTAVSFVVIKSKTVYQACRNTNWTQNLVETLRRTDSSEDKSEWKDRMKRSYMLSVQYNTILLYCTVLYCTHCTCTLVTVCLCLGTLHIYIYIYIYIYKVCVCVCVCVHTRARIVSYFNGLQVIIRLWKTCTYYLCGKNIYSDLGRLIAEVSRSLSHSFRILSYDKSVDS